MSNLPFYFVIVRDKFITTESSLKRIFGNYDYKAGNEVTNRVLSSSDSSVDYSEANWIVRFTRHRGIYEKK